MTRLPFFLPCLISLIYAALFYEPPKNQLKLPDHQSFFIKGKITRVLGATEKNYHYLAQVKEVTLEDSKKNRSKKNNDLQKIINQKILISTDQNNCRGGDFFSENLKLKKPPYFLNPGGFNYQKYLAYQKIHFKTFVKKEGFDCKKSPHFLDRIKNQFYDRTDLAIQTYKTSNSTALIPTLLWGLPNPSASSQKKLYQKIGLGHLLVISGLHFGMISWFIYQTCFWCYRKFFYRGGLFNAASVAAFVSWFLVSIYFFLCQDTASIWRAYILISLVLLAKVSKRPVSYLNILFIGCTFILWVDWGQFYNLSFQFSFLAVFALVGFLPHLNQTKKNKGFFKKILLATLVIHLVLAPLGLFYFQKLHFFGLIFNFIFIPLFEFFLVPLTFLSMVLSQLWVDAGSLLFYLPIKTLELIKSLFEFFDSLLPLEINFFKPRLSELALYFIILMILFKTTQLKIKIRWGFLVGLLLTLLILFNTLPKYTNDQQTIVTQFDVGQGDASLIELPGPYYLLVDTGGMHFFDTGKSILLPALNHLRIPHLDAVIITHADFDHYGGLESLLKNFKVKEIWGNQDLLLNDDLKKIVNSYSSITQRIFKRGDHFKLGENDIFIFNPKPSNKLAKKNNQSLVFQIKNKTTQLFFSGDIEALTEFDIIDNFDPKKLESNYLKIAHHGSRSSSQPFFLEAINPDIAMISSGRNHIFGHPHLQTIDRLKKRSIKTFSTANNGAIQTIFQKEDFKKKSVEVFFGSF